MLELKLTFPSGGIYHMTLEMDDKAVEYGLDLVKRIIHEYMEGELRGA